MRISDWSSDLCSSDHLVGGQLFRALAEGRAVDQLADMLEPRRAGALGQQHSLELLDVVGKLIVSGLCARSDRGFRMRRHARILTDFAPPETALRQADSGMRPTAHVTVWALAEHARATSPTLRSAPRRSEEHTSELQSLMT